MVPKFIACKVVSPKHIGQRAEGFDLDQSKSQDESI